MVTTPSDREILMTRVFEAPRELVFKAWSEPELIKKWMYGPDEWKLEVCETDFRVGGRIRWEWHGANGGVMGLTGSYREIDPPNRIVHTEVFDEDWTGGETLVTVEFEEQDGKTTAAMTVLYSSKESRDAVLKTDMAVGMKQSYDRLDQLLDRLGSGGV